MMTTTTSRIACMLIVRGCQLLGLMRMLSTVQPSSAVAQVSHWCGITAYHQKNIHMVYTAANIAWPHDSGAPIGRRRPYTMTAPTPRKPITSSVMKATTWLATPREIAHIEQYRHPVAGDVARSTTRPPAQSHWVGPDSGVRRSWYPSSGPA